MKTKVVTYQAPNGACINLAPRQIAALKKAGQWPRNASGEYCCVSHGLHAGKPTWDAKEAMACGMEKVAEMTFKASMVQAGIEVAKEAGCPV